LVFAGSLGGGGGVHPGRQLIFKMKGAGGKIREEGCAEAAKMGRTIGAKRIFLIGGYVGGVSIKKGVLAVKKKELPGTSTREGSGSW